MKSVYIETTIVSYLTSRPTQDMIQTAHQHITRQWWHYRASHFNLFTSQVVVREAAAGDSQASAARLNLLESLPLLDITQEAEDLAVHLLRRRLLPTKAADDALHLAIAAVHGTDYLLTWNCRHLANAELAEPIAETILQCGHRAPVVCTPEALMGAWR